jgi:hypothetical protein
MDRRFHLDNHEKCYFMDGLRSNPRLLYQLPHAPAKEKISTMMQYFMHVKPGCCSEEETSVISLGLRDDGYLLVMNADTGVILRSICLSSTVKYRHLAWADYLYSVQVKSVLHPQLPQGLRFQRDPANPAACTELLRFIIFDVHPIRLRASFKIDQRVFGYDVKDASIDGDILLLYLSNKKLCRIYNLKQLLKNSTICSPQLGDKIEDKLVGRSPMGIPLTVDIKEIPPVLLEVASSSQNGVSFGGCPFHYIHSSVKNSSLFTLRSIVNSAMVWEFSSSDLTLNSDLVEFHFDDYQRMFQIVGGTLKCYHMSVNNKGETSVDLCYVIDFNDAVSEEQTPANVPVVTRSGRTVKKLVNYDSFTSQQCLIHEVDYENELDLVYAVVTNGGSPSSTFLVFFDDWTGNILKTFPLETWQEVGDHVCLSAVWRSCVPECSVEIMCA